MILIIIAYLILIFLLLRFACYKDWTLTRKWNTLTDHNHLRMTRVLKCFQELDMQEEFNDFSMRLSYIMSCPECQLSDDTRQIWHELINT